MWKKKAKNTSARRSLIVLLLLDVAFVANVCYKLFWAPPTYPPRQPLGAVILAIYFCWDTARRMLRFRELTGHWPDLRKNDLGADELKKEEIEP